MSTGEQKARGEADWRELRKYLRTCRYDEINSRVVRAILESKFPQATSDNFAVASKIDILWSSLQGDMKEAEEAMEQARTLLIKLHGPLETSGRKLDPRRSGVWLSRWKSMLRPRVVKSPPGLKLRRIGDFFFSRATFEAVLEPTLADLEDEYQAALFEGRTWKARWVKIRGYWSFWAAMAAQAPLSMIKRLFEIWKVA